MEELQNQVDKLKTAQADREKREVAEHRRSLGAQSVSCLKELYDLHHDRYCICACYRPQKQNYRMWQRNYFKKLYEINTLWVTLRISIQIYRKHIQAQGIELPVQ